MLYNQKLGETSFDNLFAGASEHIAVSCTVVAGAGELKRGTVLGMNADGKMAVFGSGEGLSNPCVLCDDVNATEADTVAEAYITGKFNKNALIVAEGYELTDADIEALRNGGIFVEIAVK